MWVALTVSLARDADRCGRRLVIGAAEPGTAADLSGTLEPAQSSPTRRPPCLGVLMSKAAVRTCLPVLFLLALAACSGAQPTDSVSVAGTAAEAPPSTENTTAVEEPQAPKEGDPAIQVASLPIGGTGPDSTGPDGNRCVTANWAPTDDAASLTQGYGVTVTTVILDPDAYLQTDGACPGPPCIGHTFRTSDLACDVSLRPTEAGKTDLGAQEIALSMKGEVLCPAPGSQPCQDFRDAVENDPRRVTVRVPVAPQAPADSNTGSGDTTPSETSSTGSGP